MAAAGKSAGTHAAPHIALTSASRNSQFLAEDRTRRIARMGPAVTATPRGQTPPLGLHLKGNRSESAGTTRLGSATMSWQRMPDTDGSGVSWSLSNFRTDGPDTVEVQSARAPEFVFTQVPLTGCFDAELACGQPYGSHTSGLIRPRASGALYRFAGKENRVFGALAPLSVIERWFGGHVPAPIRPLLEGAGSTTVVRPRPLPAYLRHALLAALSASAPLRGRMVGTVAQQILGFHLESLCADLRPRVTPLARSRALDAHAMLVAQPEHPPSIAGIAAEFGVSARRLEEAYRIEFGTSFNRAVQQVRLEAICAALREGEAIKVVAARFGYSNVSNFSSAFRRRMGSPPRKWLERQAVSRR